ncbi:hypothetical protein OSB04_016048 [Centaurea solstitialis]|uniref:PGG domain-containing protein n=1 Tax=Centaurea solstitialis TaxID=347529 RepID=A0AA38T7Y2_9ASTR|nr:hypothetical protein OSB04_016048 [Centaurea solstitialis]
MADSTLQMQSLKYQAASNVNVSNFVSVKLSSDDNYPLWKAQMLCLMESQQMRGIVDNLFDDPGATYFKTIKQYDSLLKGWIFGSLSPDVLRVVVDLESAKEVWWKLQSIYDEEKRSEQDPASKKRLDLDLSVAEGTCPFSLKHYIKRTVLDYLPQKQKVTLDLKFDIYPDPSKHFVLIEMPTVIVPKEIDTIRKEKLFHATVKGRWWEAQSILENDQQAAMEAISDDGNTMLHLAVEIGQNDFVKHLLDFIDDGKQIEKKNSDGRTALHIAAIVGNKRAAELLVEKRHELVGIADHKAIVPLFSAYYNMKVETFGYLLDVTEINGQSPVLGFIPSSDPLRSKVNLLITLIFTKQYDLASTWVNRRPELVTRDDQVLMALVKTFPDELGFVEELIYPSLNNLNVRRRLVKRCSLLFHSYKSVSSIGKDILWAKRDSGSYVLSNISIGSSLHLSAFLPFLVLHLILWKILATLVAPIKRIDKKKKDYINATKILNLVCDHIDELNISDSNHPCYSKPILEAARQGSYEVVKEILFRSPKIIGSKLNNGHNIIQIAVINRSEKVYNLICHFNNILHLAGRLAPSSVLNRTTGAALQLQRELQWRKEVKKFMSPKELVEKNVDMETPKMVFTREHKTLMKEGEKWMKTTAESCSITAALITTIVFAAAITVPGGSNQETGIPLFKNDIAFTIFAVSDAISLFASSTALLVFLSILTARFSAQDFLVSLPRRLIIGLCTLFLSTIAMMVAFSAILFLVFCDQRAWMLAPIGGLACFPIAAIVTLQFPLVVDLILSTHRPIFLAECNKSNMNIMRASFSKQRSDRVPNPTSVNHGEQPVGFVYIQQDLPTYPTTTSIGCPGQSRNNPQQF